MRSLITLSCVVIIGIVGCSNQPKPSALSVLGPATIASDIGYNYNKDVEITQGNRSYLPLNIVGNPAGHVREILAAYEGFEKAHPELEVTGRTIEKQDGQFFVNFPSILGLWVDHRPRSKETK